MPNAKGTGGKQRKRGKNENEISKREVVLKGEGEAYGVIIAALGNYQMSVRLEDLTTVTGIVRGALRKKTWVNAGDLVRVALRTGFEDGTVDIVGKYTPNEANELNRNGEVSANLIAGPQASEAAADKGTNLIRITQTTGAAVASENAKDKTQDPNSRKKNIDMAPIMRNFNRQGAGIGDSDDENVQDSGPQWKPNKRKGDSDDDDSDNEDEEGEEGEEGEEEEEEEEEDTGANAASYYDEGKDNNNRDWEKYHHNKKDQDYKQRNKRAKENKPQVGVTAADVSDI
jgi:translation initiation factor 1A